MKLYRLTPLLLLLVLAGCRSSVLDDPSTTISFGVPQPSHVKLTVTNNYNTVVMTLVDSDLTGGTYRTDFNASGLLEGVYYYTLEADGIGNNYHFKQTKYLLMIK